MRVWTVHAPPAARGPVRDHEGAAGFPARLRFPVLVPEGFAWLAFLFGLPWLLAHRLWLEAALYLGGFAALALLLPAPALAPISLAVQLLLGAHAQDLRRLALARRGYLEAHVVAERDADRALARLLEAKPELIYQPAPDLSWAHTA